MKTPILMLHGALGDSRQFDEVKGILSNSIPVFTMNFSGHGGSLYDGTLEMEVFVQDIHRFLEENSLEKVHLFGYSMGGYAAMCFAYQYPSKVEKIMTLGTKYAWTPETAKKEVALLNPDMIAEKVPQFAAVLQRRFAPLGWRDSVHKTADLLVQLGNKPPLTVHEYKQIPNIVLIGLGSEDNMVSKEESQYVADTLPKGVFQMFDGWKHPIEKVDKKELANEINKFFTSN